MNTLKSYKYVLLLLLSALTLLSGCSVSTDNNSDTTEDEAASVADVVISSDNAYEEYITLGQYKGIHYTPYDTEVHDSDLQSKIDSILLEDAEVIEITSRGAETDDVVTADCEVSFEGELIEDLSQTDYSFTLGSDDFLFEGADEAVIGKEKDEEFTFSVTVPEDCSELSDYSGKTLTVKMKIDKIIQQETYEFNDEFVEEYTDGEYTSAQKYKTYLAQELKSEYEAYAEQKMRSDIWDSVKENCTVKGYDEEYYNSYYEQLEETTAYLADMYDLGYEEFIDLYYGTDLETYAKDNIIEEYIVYAVANKENITVTDEEYNEFLESYASSQSYDSVENLTSDFTDDILQYYSLRECVTQFLCDNAVAD
ncbi:MAG: FKBP-type peptidyl-prolyl cis-trans isomerase [Clostridiales bacterium]|nr:FKBP-type peptidyl-prolyl cis-trans isomerase [Clostridiales bacterium]